MWPLLSGHLRGNSRCTCYVLLHTHWEVYVYTLSVLKSRHPPAPLVVPVPTLHVHLACVIPWMYSSMMPYTLHVHNGSTLACDAMQAGCSLDVQSGASFEQDSHDCNCNMHGTVIASVTTCHVSPTSRPHGMYHVTNVYHVTYMACVGCPTRRLKRHLTRLSSISGSPRTTSAAR